MPTVAVTDATFQTDVLESEVPVLVDFWATWCGPCRAIAPVLEELSDTYAGRCKIAKLDVDQNPMISTQLRIQSIPTMVLFIDGRPAKAVQGALPKEALTQFLDEHLPAPAGASITVQELAGQIQAGLPVQVFDIRDPRDFSRSHLRHAKCVAVDALPPALAELAPGTLAVLVDRTGEGALEAAENLAGQPVRVMALTKGLLEWEGSGLPTYNDREEAALDAEAS